MKIALIAHDRMKEEIVQLATAYESILAEHELYATGTTGARIMDATSLKLTRFLSGPLGGDQQIGAKIARNEMDLIIFLRDPLTSQPHEPDIIALLRLCDVHKIPFATNLGSAEIMLKALERGELSWREVLHEENEA
ncbi:MULTISPECIES: methylglyoxal synthase [Brevibacillus]|uniref:Methylglyoxal synthase n=1 Tax=Brevibacillus parabrevis TaxID=54914 RepID=A0A4Y3PE75_BREPA|nr:MULTISPECIES: methylglyoxal synthase [Brevibacillus]NRQ52284.1 methylglyoxal synthase [Brevibacillus sp. HD1.4A]TGV17907.1 methylglyoxal synthase [Mesorhizobium sp. M00.F.Ca.ET.186.01.1.1]KZE55496.1 methylglyoxal synthase [Brevibacillus parabrevis]MBU8712188.1 methylglyoxal synthase [Brevibacillus parabrevis]MDH6349256.1 methylglyoxal synthase [Brevibacillus sp. 1238]